MAPAAWRAVRPPASGQVSQYVVGNGAPAASRGALRITSGCPPVQRTTTVNGVVGSRPSCSRTAVRSDERSSRLRVPGPRSCDVHLPRTSAKTDADAVAVDGARHTRPHGRRPATWRSPHRPARRPAVPCRGRRGVRRVPVQPGRRPVPASWGMYACASEASSPSSRTSVGVFGRIVPVRRSPTQ